MFVTSLHIYVRESDRLGTFGTGIVKMKISVTYGILYIDKFSGAYPTFVVMKIYFYLKKHLSQV